MSSRIRRIFIARVLAALTIAIGATALAGWIFHIPMLTTVLPGLVNMKVNTTLGFILSGTALFLTLGDPGRQVSRIIEGLCAIVALIGILTLVEYASTIDFKIDQFLYHRPGPQRGGAREAGRLGNGRTCQ